MTQAYNTDCMEAMERGTKVWHKLTQEALIIKKDYGIVVSCYSKRYREISPGKVTSVSVCSKINIIQSENKQ